MLITIYESAQSNTSKDLNHQQHRCENFQSCSVNSCSPNFSFTMCLQSAVLHVTLYYYTRIADVQSCGCVCDSQKEDGAASIVVLILNVLIYPKH
jgi:hypothetical protein